MSPRPRKASDDEVFAAAMRVMGRVGPADLTLAEIGAEAGVTAGALVQRFGSKLELLRALSRQASGDPGGALADIRARHPSPLAALGAYARCMAALAPTPAALARNLAYLHLDLTDRHLYPALVRLARHTREAYRRLLSDAVAAGEVRAGVDLDDLARLVDTTAGGSLMSWAVYRVGTASEWIGRDIEIALAPHVVPASAVVSRSRPRPRKTRPRVRG